MRFIFQSIIWIFSRNDEFSIRINNEVVLSFLVGVNGGWREGYIFYGVYSYIVYDMTSVSEN